MTDAAVERLERILPNEAATLRFAADLAMSVRAGDLVTLSGDLGAGKTTLIRALIRKLAGDPALDVPSPTFTLMQVYEVPGLAIVHADLYRLGGPDELAELGWDEAADGAVVCVEWPERAGDLLDVDRLDIALELVSAEGPMARRVVITGYGSFAPRARRLVEISDFLADAGLAAATRSFLQGDASSRRYERLALKDRRSILMDAPKRPDGPPVKNGLPYSRIAHLAEDVAPFVAMAQALGERGFSAPRIEAFDLSRGLLVIEDLGPEPVVAGDPPAPIPERYGAAVDVLVTLHGMALPAALPVPGAPDHRLPRYDLDAMLAEVELLLDWYLPHMGLPAFGLKPEFLRRWSHALQEAALGPTTWVLRDYHSPNLIWLPAREGIQQVGLIDFQDALMGPAAYDLVSLLQDARVDVPETLELALFARYVKARRAADPTFDAATFARLYAVMGAQRATKILGIFARLNKRDRKPGYLKHLPRVWKSLVASLRHPALADLRGWYADQVAAPDGSLFTDPREADHT
jgi:tRNA threonylcarbamoyl adenosine modification protein YjeE